MIPKTFLSTFLFFLPLYTWALTVIVPGKIVNAQDSIVRLVVNSTALGDENKIYKASINDRNAFQFKIEIDRPVFAEFRHAGIRFPIFLNPDKLTSLTLTANDYTQGTVRFRGPGKDDNTFYLEYFKFVATQLENKQINEIKKTRAKDFKTFVKSREEGKFEFIKAYLEKTDVELSKPLQIWVRNDIKYQTADLLLKYPYLFNMANNGMRSKELPKKYYKFLENVRINNDQAIHQPSYRSFLEGYFFNYRIESAKDWQYLTSYNRQFEYVEHFFVGDARYYLQSIILKEGINHNPRYIEKEYYQFLESKAPVNVKKKVRAIFTKATRQVKGEKLEATAFVHPNGQAIPNSYFKNKISYIFFWSTREKHSIYEMRYVRTLAKKFEEDENVNIVLVNMDGNLERLNQFIQTDEYRLNLYNVQHLFMDRKKSAHFFEKYRFEGTPEFFLVDHTARIVSNHTWSPSSGSAPRLIRKLLEDSIK